MWWRRLFVSLGLWPVLGCKAGRSAACGSWFSHCINLRCLLSCRSLLKQLQKLRASLKQSKARTTITTCGMVSGFSPKCL